uniref:G_PROTEIN_RECEP_F1_2 domain-containing protein n=1 Tax=Rhabditophanes sp. KR3021 TaxID=114890 RepID=A0AC35U3A3_9BILA
MLSITFNILIFCMSMFTNTLVLSMYKQFKVAGKMEPGILVIFLQCITDMLFSTTSLIFHNEVLFQNNYVSICFVYLNHLNFSQLVYAAIFFVFVTTLNFNFFMVTLTVWARYATITKKQKITVKRLLLIFFVNVLICYFLSGFVLIYGLDFTADPYIIAKYFQVNNISDKFIKSTSTAISLKTNEWTFLIGMIPICVYININMTSIFQYLLKYRSFMKSQFQFMSSKTRTLGNDFFRILVLQLCAPLCLHFAPLLLYVVIIFSKLNFVSFGSIAFQLSSTVPVFNPIFFLIFLTKSRCIMKCRIQKIANFISCGKIVVEHLNSVTSMVPKSVMASSINPKASTSINKNVV